MHTSFLTLSHSDRYMTWHCSWKKISCSSILFTPTTPISHIRQRVDVSPGTISQRERRRFHARANFSSAQYFSDWKPDLNIFHWWTWPCIIFLQFKSQTMPEKFSTGPVQCNCPHLDCANPGNWSNTQRTSKGANPTHQSTNSVAIWVGFVSFKLVQSTYMFSAT